MGPSSEGPVVDACAKCGRVHPRCAAHPSGAEVLRPCGRAPMKGSRVCRSHGGAAKQVKAKAAERTAEQDARKAFGKLSDHAVPVDDPFAEFAKLAGEAVAWKDWAAGRIADLERIDSTDAKGTEQVRAQVALFERAMDRCAGFLRDFAKLGIEDRMSRVTVAQRVAIVRAIESVMAHLGVAGEERPVVDAILARELSTGR